MTEHQFVKKWIEKITNDLLTKFPDDYIKELETESFELPGKSFSIASELFGQYELLDINGNKVIQTEDHYLAKYLLYSNRTKPKSVSIPIENEEIKNAVKQYEKLLDTIIKQLLDNIKVVLPTEDNMKLSNQIFNMINLNRY